MGAGQTRLPCTTNILQPKTPCENRSPPVHFVKAQTVRISRFFRGGSPTGGRFFSDGGSSESGGSLTGGLRSPGGLMGGFFGSFGGSFLGAFPKSKETLETESPPSNKSISPTFITLIVPFILIMTRPFRLSRTIQLRIKICARRIVCGFKNCGMKKQ